jgi:hypothetical protein
MNNLINRAKELILSPKLTWEIIKNEDVKILDFLKTYVLPLALIPAIASFIGYGLIGFNLGGFGRIALLEWGVSAAIQSLLSSFSSILIISWVISKLAPKYECEVSMDKSTSLVGHAFTPALVSGVFYIIPSLSIIAMLGGIYSLYVLYIGFPVMTGVSEIKKTNFMLITILASIAVYILVAIVLTSIFGSYANYNF